MGRASLSHKCGVPGKAVQQIVRAQGNVGDVMTDNYTDGYGSAYDIYRK